MYGHERSLVESFSGRPFVLLGVNNDKEISVAKKAISKNELNWRSWYDGKGGPIIKDYGIRSFPTIFLIDHEGVIRYKNLRGKRLDLALESLVTAAEDAGMRGGSEPGPKFREFVDLTGKYRTVAAYSGFDEGKVILRKEDADEVKVPWLRLSMDDRQYVAAMRLKESGIRKNLGEFSFDQPFRFTDSSGDFIIEATFVALNKGKAILWKTDGCEASITFKQLSDESRAHIRNEIKRMN